MTDRVLEGQGDGSFVPLLSSDWGSLILICAEEVLGMLENDSDLNSQLTPAAHPGDPEEQAKFDELVGSDITNGRLSDLKALADLPNSESLSGERVEASIRALTVIRLIYGEFLDYRTQGHKKSPKQTGEEEPVLAPLGIKNDAFSRPAPFYKKTYVALAALQEQMLDDFVSSGSGSG